MLKIEKWEVALPISRHEGILNKHLCKNFFEENWMPVFLLRFECRTRRLNSNKESHWLQVSTYKLLEYYSSNMNMQSANQFSSTLASFINLVVFIKNINVLSLRHQCFPENIRSFLKQQKQPPEEFRKKSVLKNFAIFTRKHLCLSLFDVFWVNFIKKRLQRSYSKQH